ncbi:MAG TPA: ATP-binding protein [Acetobacteraceae bacterium]|nr:ATP-binding protein [Acetobacteraceae bacterium]
MSDEKTQWLERLQERVEAQEADPEWQAKRAEELAHLEARRKARVLRELEAIDVPVKDVALIKAGNLLETEAFAAVSLTDWKLLALSGGAGTGKTTAASCWLWSAVDAAIRDDFTGGRPPMLFLTAARLSRWPKYDDEQMRRVLKAHRLVIDDLGAEYVDKNGSYLSLLDEVVNERYANRRATLLTTNLEVGPFKERYGERIADRIREIGRFVSVGNKSMRRKDAA